MKMELWIRSQDRTFLRKVNTPESYENSGAYYELLGTYKTKERAIEVLDEIQNYILLPNTDNSAYVYNMPED